MLTFVGEKLIAEKRRLEREEDMAEEKLLSLQKEMNTQIARIMRLRRLQKEVVRKGHLMIRDGFKDLDEMEKAEEEANAEIVSSVQTVEAFVPTDWSSVGLENVDFSSLLGGTSLEVGGSSADFP